MAKTSQAKYKCFYCGKEYVESNYYKSNSKFFNHIGKIPYCKHCIGRFYEHYYDKYLNEGCPNPEQEAVKRVCMAFDMYYSAKVYNDAINDAKKRNMNVTPLAAYIRVIQLNPHNKKSYDDTIEEMRNEEQEFINKDDIKNYINMFPKNSEQSYSANHNHCGFHIFTFCYIPSFSFF